MQTNEKSMNAKDDSQKLSKILISLINSKKLVFQEQIITNINTPRNIQIKFIKLNKQTYK